MTSDAGIYRVRYAGGVAEVTKIATSSDVGSGLKYITITAPSLTMGNTSYPYNSSWGGWYGHIMQFSCNTDFYLTYIKLESGTINTHANDGNENAWFSFNRKWFFGCKAPNGSGQKADASCSTPTIWQINEWFPKFNWADSYLEGYCGNQLGSYINATNAVFSFNIIVPASATVSITKL